MLVPESGISRVEYQMSSEMGVKQLVVTIFIFVLIQLWCCNGFLEDERIALLQIQTSFNISWDPFDKTTNSCDWRRIECDAHTGRVTHLYLSGALDWDLVEWYLNASLFLSFKQLNYLYLSDNQITGCLQNEGFERLTEMNKLEYLVLSFNNFNKKILPSLGGLLFLKSLDISYNNLKGSIYLGEPASLKNLEEFRMRDNNIADISFNNLNGSIKLEELASLKSLEELNLSGNKNISEFASSKDVRAPPNLNTIYLDDMTANGMPHLLKSLTQFSSLKTLYLQFNNLTKSSFHHDLQSFKSLEYLYLHGSIVDDNFFRSLHTFALKSLSIEGGNGLHNLQGLCSLNYLQSLDLSFNNLGGGLPSCLSNFTSLQYLDLSFNSLVGNLSSSPLSHMNSIKYLDLQGNKFQIPISLVPFYNCSNLSHLELRGNELYVETEWHNLIPKFQLEELYMRCHGCGGSFPKFLYNQHNLQGVDLRDNKIRGEFPHWLLENNTRLEYLFLSNNSLTGTIRLPTHSHVKLSNLDISTNFFSSQVPTKFGSYFPNLKYLSMFHNELNGSLPSSIGNLSSLYQLDMSNNELHGSIPPSIGNLISLYQLDMSNNELHGSIPPSIVNLSSMVVLDFNHNRLSGEIPSWWETMEFLEILDLSRNNIFGNLPRFVGASSLTEVYMSKNMLHGSFLHAFSDCSQLTVLDLSHNLLTEDLSRWNDWFPQVDFLLLGHNMLEGEIPRQLCSLRTLNYIDLSNNKLSGPIPSCLIYYSNWYREHGENSHLPNYFVQGPNSAAAPVEVGAPWAQPQQPIEINTKNNSLSYKGMILTLYSGLDLSCNNLSGQIPPEFGSLNQIKTLNLSHNRLTGSIPATFSNLDQIESLDLSYNKLQGNIPSQLTHLPFLSSFNVAYNNLSGRTPEMIKQFATFNNDSYEGNLFLCGEPLSRSCSPKPHSAMPTPTASNEEESGFIDMRIFYVSFVVTYTIVLSGIGVILYINPYWRRAWFYFLERKMEDCYYFAIYDCPRFFKFRA